VASVLGIIPARYASSRFPGKPLLNLGGKSMIQRVYEQTCLSHFDKVIIATDDDRIFTHSLSFVRNSTDVMMTNIDHINGTERCAEVVQKMDTTYNTIINVQGDEPFISHEALNTLISLMTDKNVQIGTLCNEMPPEDIRLESPNTIKIVLNNKSEAMYFSRAKVPYQRNNVILHYYRHIGVYGFRYDIFQKIIKLPPSPLEQTESLEQLRWMEAGFTIRVATTDYISHSIDTPEDVPNIIMD